MTDLPCVSAVMVTGKVPWLEDRLLPIAIRSILAQSYTPLELILVSDRQIPCPPFWVAGCVKPVEAQGTLGDLRNAGLNAATGDLICQADSDDYHHPERIARQVAAYEPGKPVFLKRQLCYNWLTDTAFVREFPPLGLPIFGTILHPNDGKRYPSLKATEDTVFAHQYPHWITIDNDPCLYVRFFHGGNTTAERDVMRGHDEPGKWDLTKEQAAYLRDVLSQYRR